MIVSLIQNAHYVPLNTGILHELLGVMLGYLECLLNSMLIFCCLKVLLFSNTTAANFGDLHSRSARKYNLIFGIWKFLSYCDIFTVVFGVDIYFSLRLHAFDRI